MPRRNLIPLALLAVLIVATAVFAVLGAAAAPNATTVTVENATAKTFGSPTGSISFLMDLVTTVSSGAKSGTLSQERLVDYQAPDRMVVYQVGTSVKTPSVIPQSEISCTLSVYTAMLEGPAAWNAKGDNYTRTETLADYSARVPRTGGTTCTPQEITAQGQVHETAVIRSGYLVAARVKVVVPSQTLRTGQTAAHGVEGQTMIFVEIGGVPVRSIKP
jgi:hypothetical protein